MILLLKVVLCAFIAVLVVYSLFHLFFVRVLRCNKCGEVVPEEEYRSHKYKCDQKD